MTAALHDLYRPKYYKEVIGQDTAIKVLKQVIADDSTQAFLFHGPSGTGKTTLARIAALEVGCDPINITEVPAAVFTGVESMRQLQDQMAYIPFGESKARALIIDECHRLSKQAWDSLLKMTEEPPPDVYIFLCTTEVAKVPHTIQTRFTKLALKPVTDHDIEKLIYKVMTAEGFKLEPDIVRVIVQQSRNSPRQALVYLAMCRDAKTRKEAADRIQAAVSTDPIIALARFLLWETGWEKAMLLVQALQDEEPESIRIVISRYMATVAIGANKPEEGEKKPLKRTERDIMHTLRILQAFSRPFNPTDGMAPVVLAIGEVLFEQ